MAYIIGKTKNHQLGAFWEDFIFDYFKKKRKVVREINPHFDFKENDEKGSVLYEVKSKLVKFNKDDRKLDVSDQQLAFYKKALENGQGIKIVVVWYTEKGTY
ncbi:MAG: hypothetical protein GXN92_03610, partial [Candidatus Micrarchaeota archaeon]|nr:hypothetical protein [Candidatus Micrarchaeota archaeon]